jgi:uncharacterized protein YceK
MPGQTFSLGRAIAGSAFILVDMPFGVVLDTAALPSDLSDQIEYDKGHNQVPEVEKKEPSG